MSCQWCRKVAVLADSNGEMLCPQCRDAIAMIAILSSLPDSLEDAS